MQLSPRGSEDDKGSQPLIEARIVKDSYHVPHDPVVLERCQGGALRTVESRKPSNEAICQATLSWLLANPDTPVSAGAIRNRLGHGAEAYAAIVREIPAATAPTIFKAIQWGIAERALEQQSYRNAHGDRRMRLAPGPATSGYWPTEDLQEELRSGVLP